MEQTIETSLTDRQIFALCREQLHRFCPDLSPGLLDALSLGWRIVRFKRRELLLKAGVVPNEAHLVIEGLVPDLSSYLGLSRQNVTLIRKRILQG